MLEDRIRQPRGRRGRDARHRTGSRDSRSHWPPGCVSLQLVRVLAPHVEGGGADRALGEGADPALKAADECVRERACPSRSGLRPPSCPAASVVLRDGEDRALLAPWRVRAAAGTVPFVEPERSGALTRRHASPRPSRRFRTARTPGNRVSWSDSMASGGHVYRAVADEPSATTLGAPLGSGGRGSAPRLPAATRGVRQTSCMMTRGTELVTDSLTHTH